MSMLENTIAILNNIRDNASTEYQTRIPEATRTNITTIGNALSTYVPLLNEFTGTLIGKIGLTIFTGKTFSNPLKPFKSGELTDGSDVEEIMVQMASGVAYDPDGKTALARTKPDVKALYHRQNRQDTYPISVSDAQVKMAFHSESGVSRLLQEIVSSMYSGSDLDEFIMMKELLAGYAANYATYDVAPITDETTAKEFIKTTRKAVMDLKYPSTLYNAEGVKMWNDPQDLALFVNKDVIAETDVEVLAKAFNIGKTDFEPTIIVLDDFGSLTDTYGVLADKEFFKVFDTLHSVESIRNPQGLFTNYFLHVWQVQSLSKFRNAIRFKKVTG
jgi:hypothetical protein